MSRVNPPTIEIYPMKTSSDGSSTIHEGRDQPDFYDVIVRYPGDDPLEEDEDIYTYAQAMTAARALQKKYPGAQIEEIKA